MSKKIVSIITMIAIILTMIVPTMAGNGDGTGDDTFPSSITIHNATLLGEYTLGTEKIFKISTYASGSEGTVVNRKVEITGDTPVSTIEFLDGGIWKDIREYNTQINLANDAERQIRVVFGTAGIYTIIFTLTDTNGDLLKQAKRVVSVSNDGIALYKEPETTVPVTTTEEVDTIPETTTTEPETTTETLVETITLEEPTSTETSETTTVEQVETTTLVEITTTIIVDSTVELTTEATEKVTAPAKAKIKKVNGKKESSKKVKISLKKIKGADGYQVAIYKSKKNAKKNKKAMVKKIVKKRNVTIKSKKLKNKKNLFVKVRAYVLEANNKKLYGKWSKMKKVKINE